MAGSGTFTDPWDLTTLNIQSSSIPPGSTVYLRGGVYSGDFGSGMNGTEDAPIIVRPYQNETVIIDGSFIVCASYCHYYNLIFRHSGWTTRTTDLTGSDPADLPDEKTFVQQGLNCKYINCIFHDTPGPEFWPDGFEAYGCIMYYNGWSGPDRGHGHGFYTQNSVNPAKIRNCLIFNNFELNIKIYSQSVGKGENYLVEGNTCWNAGVMYDYVARGSDEDHKWWNIFAGGFAPMHDIEITRNYTWTSVLPDYGQSSNDLGYNWQYGGIVDLILNDNYWASQGVVLSTSGVTVAEAERNEFYGEVDSGFLPSLDETNTIATYPPTVDRVFIEPNEYDTNRIHVTVYNWTHADSVTVDVSDIAVPGDIVEAWNVQGGVNISGARQDVTYHIVASDSTITISMLAVDHTMAVPFGNWPAPDTTLPEFGVFVLQTANSGAVASITFTPSSRSMIFS